MPIDISCITVSIVSDNL